MSDFSDDIRALSPARQAAVANAVKAMSDAFVDAAIMNTLSRAEAALVVRVMATILAQDEMLIIVTKAARVAREHPAP